MQSEAKKISIQPYGDDSVGNEHWIYVHGDEFEDARGDMSLEMEARILEIFPDGDGRGTRVEISRQPTEAELERLQTLASEVGAETEFEIRTNEQYEELRKARRQPMPRR